MAEIYAVRRSLFGPILIVSIGVVFLLLNMGLISRVGFLRIFSLYWPVLLIILGLVRMVEYWMARRSQTPVARFGGGSIFLLIFFILIGLGASGMRAVNWHAIGENVDINDDDLGGIFGERYDFTEKQDADLPANGSVRIENLRGTVKVTPSADAKVHITTNRHIRSESQEDAAKFNQSWKANVTTEGSLLRIVAGVSTGTPEVHIGFYAGPRITADLEVEVPVKAAVEVLDSRGDVDINTRENDVKVTTTRGDVNLMGIKGNADITTNTRNDVQAHNVTGNVVLHGRQNDIEIADVGGTLDFDGDFYGSMKLERVGKRVRFHTSRTELEFVSLTGDFYMDRGELRATSVAGPFRVQTRAKDIHLEDITGDVNVENSRAEVEIHPKSPFGSVNVQNSGGPIRVIVPATANYAVDAKVSRGDVQTDFELNHQSNGPNSDAASGNIGKGGANRLQLTTDRASIEIRKG